MSLPSGVLPPVVSPQVADEFDFIESQPDRASPARQAYGGKRGITGSKRSMQRAKGDDKDDDDDSGDATIIDHPRRKKRIVLEKDESAGEGSAEGEVSGAEEMEEEEEKGVWVGQPLPSKAGDSTNRVYHTAIDLPWVEGGPIKLHDYVLLQADEGITRFKLNSGCARQKRTFVNPCLRSSV
jgi:hypothetical protein